MIIVKSELPGLGVPHPHQSYQVLGYKASNLLVRHPDGLQLFRVQGTIQNILHVVIGQFLPIDLCPERVESLLDIRLQVNPLLEHLLVKLGAEIIIIDNIQLPLKDFILHGP